MTPKEKALELLNKYYNLFNPDYPNINVLFKDCKKCALITVDEIIESCIQKFEWYWIEVKQEIEKL